MVRRRQFLRIYSLEFWDIWQNFYFYLILNNKSFIMEVEQTNFVIHLIITVQLYYWLSENLSVNKFQVLIINYYSKLCARLYENLISKFHVKPRKSEVLRLYSIIHIAMETMKMSNFTCQSKSVISIFFFYLPSFSLWATTFLLSWFGKWHIPTNCQNCVQPP